LPAEDIGERKEREEKNMVMRKSILAVFVCAVFAVVLAAPVVQSDTGDSHLVYKDENGPPSTCALDWVFTPTAAGIWHGHVVNGGMRWVIFDVVDESTGAVMVDRDMYRFAVYTNVFDTEPIEMVADHNYRITVTPNGPLYSNCTVTDVFEPFIIPNEPPVAAFTFTVDGDTVSVDASASDDPDGEIVSYQWTWGDGTTGTGMTATHTYVEPTVRENPPGTPFGVYGYTFAADGVTKLASCDVTITNVATGFSWSTISGITGFYSIGIYGTAGDTILVEAAKGDLYGFTESVATGVTLNVDVTLVGEEPPVPVDFEVTLTVTDDDGATDSVTQTVTVYL
jgi:hypothetical protein